MINFLFFDNHKDNEHLPKMQVEFLTAERNKPQRTRREINRRGHGEFKPQRTQRLKTAEDTEDLNRRGHREED
jgi:hypothetical protein